MGESEEAVGDLSPRQPPCYDGRMKAASAILMFAALGIAGFAMFGVATMTHGSGHGGWCPVAPSSSDCPTPANALAAVSFHLDGMRGFFTATAAHVSAALLLAFFGLIAVLSASRRFISDGKPVAASHVLSRAAHGSFSRRETRLIRWLALRENSPAPASRARA